MGRPAKLFFLFSPLRGLKNVGVGMVIEEVVPVPLSLLEKSFYHIQVRFLGVD